MTEILNLAVKAAATASVVAAASFVAERSRPSVAAAILSLPISAGPAYALLALEHDPAFIAKASLMSLPMIGSTVGFILGYAIAARRGANMPAALAAALASWLAMVLVILAIPWTIATALVALAVVYGLGIVATWSWRHAVPPPTQRRWFDLPLRAALVAGLVVTVVTISGEIGPAATGVLTLVPLAYTSFIVLMHGRLGGVVVAAAMVNGLVMLIGFIGGMLGLALAAEAGRPWLGIALLILVPAIYSPLAVRVTAPSR